MNVWIFVLFSRLFVSHCFNFDTDIAVIKLGRPETKFGYAVALHVNGTRPLLLVGAPLAQSQQINTTNAGGFFSCPVTGVQRENGVGGNEQWCRQELIEYKHATDMYNDTNALKNNEVYSKNSQWLGATVSSLGTSDSQVLVCAPGYLYKEPAYMTGICYVLDNDLSFKSQHQSCSQFPKNEGHNGYGVCEMGFSGTVFKYQKKSRSSSRRPHDYGFVAGMPGSLNWKGGLVAQTYDPFSTLAQSTTISEQIGTNSYLGYSVCTGRFGFSHEDTRHITIASGAPRSSVNNTVGAIYFARLPVVWGSEDTEGLPFVTEDAGVLYNITGDEFLGSSFGYSIIALDLNSDGYDDLTIGAPNFYNGTMGSKPHGGAVYVYFSNGNKTKKNEKMFRRFVKILGPKNSQFGVSLANLNDTNKDGYPDFAVGAPFDTDGGSVSIFLGGPKKDFSTKPSQVIYGKDIYNFGRDEPLTTFGWSLSGGSDLDGNTYPDLAVGAFESDAVVLLRARPVVNIGADVSEEDISMRIDKDAQRGCSRGVAACFIVRTYVSLQQTDSGAPDINFDRNRFDCKLEVLSYESVALPRAEFDTPSDPTMRHIQEWKCGQNIQSRPNERVHRLEIPETNSDWLNPLSFRFSVSLPGDNSPRSLGVVQTEGTPLVDISRFPVLDKQRSTRDFLIKFDKKCGNNNDCESQLRMTCGFGQKLTVLDDGTFEKQAGSESYLDLEFQIDNMGEHAYESKLYVEFDQLELESPHLPHYGTGDNMVAPGSVDKQGVYVLNLGNPFRQYAKTSFILRFDLRRDSSKFGLSKPLVFRATMNTSSSELNEDDNTCEVQVRVIKRVNIGISAESKPTKVLYGGSVKGESEMEFEEDIGPIVEHQYNLLNNGGWGVSDVTVDIQWPYEVASPFRHGKWALYLMEMPVMITKTPGAPEAVIDECNMDFPEDYVNPLGILENTRYSLKRRGSFEEDDIRLRFSRSVDSVPRDKDSTNHGAHSARQTSSSYVDTSKIKQELRIKPTKRKEYKEDIYVVEINCLNKTAKCFTISCHFKVIGVNMKPIIVIRSRLWNSTLMEDYGDVNRVEISSNAKIRFDNSYGFVQNNTDDDHAMAITKAQPDLPKIPPKWDWPIWIIIAAAGLGTFLLFLIILCCWWCGFFKRKTRSNAEPLYKAEVTHQDHLLREYDT